MPGRVVAALVALRGPAVVVADVLSSLAAHPGLYAFHADADAWSVLGIGTPPDERAIYVGKAENTLASRDVAGHFGQRPRGVQSPTGSSTLRRSLAALLAGSHHFRGMPRNPAKPGHFANFGLSEADDYDLSLWMQLHLRLALWPHADVAALDAIETDVLATLLPPLNLDKVRTPWRQQVRDARKVLADQARTWTAEA